MALASTMYHSGKNPLKKVSRESEDVFTPKKGSIRRLHKAFLRYHDPENWPMLREALQAMGRRDLIGNGKHHLVPWFQPEGTGKRFEGTRKPEPAGGKALARPVGTKTPPRKPIAGKPGMPSAKPRGKR